MTEQLKQFTFYDIYYDVIAQLEDDEADRFAKRICAFVFDGADKPGKTENENCFWEIIYPHAAERDRGGKTGQKGVLSQPQNAALYLFFGIRADAQHT